jgi:hypothetical protein
LRKLQTNHDGWPSTGILSKEHVPDGVDDGPIRGPRPAAFGTLLLVFGQAFLEFPPQRARKMEVVHTPGCGSLSLIRRISFEEGDIGSLILGEMRPSSSFREKFSDRV